MELETLTETLVVVDNVVVELRVGLLDDVLLVLPPTPLNKRANTHKIKGDARIVISIAHHQGNDGIVCF
jgi:hypothetical protein